MKYYNIELSPLASVDLRYFLKDNNITFETSACYGLIHFEILASQEQAAMINSFLDELYA